MTTITQLLAPAVISLATDGGSLAGDIRRFVGPIAAVIIGVMGLRYLFGDKRSIPGFIGFLLLGVATYWLIVFGDLILGSLGDIFRAWTDAGFLGEQWMWIVPVILVSFLALLGFLARSDSPARRDSPELSEIEKIIHQARHEDELAIGEVAKLIIDQFGDSPKVRHTLNRLLVWPEHTKSALAELEKLAPPDITLAERLRDEVRLAVIVANGRGLFREGSPVDPAQLAKWTVLVEQWPELKDELRSNPELLQVLEETPSEEFTRGDELFRFLRTGPRLHAVVRRLLFQDEVST